MHSLILGESLSATYSYSLSIFAGTNIVVKLMSGPKQISSINTGLCSSCRVWMRDFCCFLQT